MFWVNKRLGSEHLIDCSLYWPAAHNKLSKKPCNCNPETHTCGNDFMWFVVFIIQLSAPPIQKLQCKMLPVLLPVLVSFSLKKVWSLPCYFKESYLFWSFSIISSQSALQWGGPNPRAAWIGRFFFFFKDAHYTSNPNFLSFRDLPLFAAADWLAWVIWSWSQRKFGAEPGTEHKPPELESALIRDDSSPHYHTASLLTA